MDFGWATTGEEASAALAQHIKGKTVLITGVSPGGLGLETARVIALRDPKLVILAARSKDKLEQAEEEVKKAAPQTPVRQLVLDLGDLKKVRSAAEEVNSWEDVTSIDVVVNNAGVMATPFSLTGDGIETQFATNHVGHFLFTQLVMGKIMKPGSPRVVSLFAFLAVSYIHEVVDANGEVGQSVECWV